MRDRDPGCPKPVLSGSNLDQISHDKTIFTSIFNPEKRFFHIGIIAKKDQASIGKITDLIFENGISSILNENISTGEDRISIRILGEGEKKLKTEDLKEALQSSPFILEVKIIESKNGYLVDRLSFPVRFTNGEEAVLIKRKGLTSMINNLRESFGTGADVILFKEGYFIGKTVAEGLLDKMGEQNLMKNISDVLQLYSAVGWGRPELLHIDFQEMKFRIAIYDNFECLDKKSERANSHFTRGDVCGFFSTIMKTELRCDEIKCVAKGDASCDFLLTKPN